MDESSIVNALCSRYQTQSLLEINVAKVRLDKAVVFPVVMDGCESWTVKKAER